jgi:hypothetical protein
MPENTEMRGHAWEKDTGMILREKRKRKKPTSRKKVAKKRYRDRLLSFIARKAKRDPAMTNIKLISTEIREIPVREPSRKALHRNIRNNPAINTSLAVARRERNGRI